MNVRWPDTVDEVFDGDQAVMLAYPTPLGGVVLTPVTNFATRDRAAGTVTINSSIGAWRKLDRIRRAPRVALAFHTRAHSATNRAEYVLAQGTATLSKPIEDYPSSIRENWERFAGPREGKAWERWLRIYHTRVGIDIAVERIVTWPDLRCAGESTVYGSPVGRPDPQAIPAKGGGSRLDHRRAAARLSRLPDTLLGWLDADGLPFVVPATVSGTDATGILLDSHVPLPPGGRRAGLTAHAFTRHVLGQKQRVHTGWLTVDDAGRAHYAPHTQRAYHLPPSKLLYRIAVGAMTRLQLRDARRSGLVEQLAG